MASQTYNFFQLTIAFLFIYFLLLLFPQDSFFLLYSIVTQLHIHIYILFSPIIMLHHKQLDIVLSATQQDHNLKGYLRSFSFFHIQLKPRHLI